ncbi:vascular endothelial growth factor receptor 1-like isoform X1 [Oryzias latipes]|uniref:vascular endothelial growth factor receptor 1-like isoform X1 n=1 Tax=Oryzias latipes TaxID=8090 RepID=UPI0005CBD205|nr:vascular endothelial growth factor receptor 1-like isoform X1 [Oryzias latipes]
MTLLLEIIFMFMLQFTGFSFEILYERVGDDAVLPCNIDRSSEQFYDVKWLIDRPDSEEISCKESVVQSSAGASRLSVSRNCSLLIRNITDEDAEKYICRLGNKKWIDYIDVYVYLNVLSISSSPSDVHGRVDLTCSFKSPLEASFFKENDIIWMNETGSQLSGKNPEFEVHKQTNCVSVLTVKHQRGNSKRFSCRFVDVDEVQIDAVYVLTDISGQTKHLYHRVGDDVLLPCRTTSSSSSCSDVTWLYQKDPNTAFREEVHNGSVVQTSARVGSDCSLLIRNITNEDAGRFLCRLGNKNKFEAYLNILSISKDPADVPPRGSGSVTFQCSLSRFDPTIPCRQNSFIWMNETGSQLSGDGVGLDCVSVLTVKHQSGNKKTFTCQFVEDDKVKTYAVYVLDFSYLSGHIFIIIFVAVVTVVLMFLGAVAALVYMSRRRTEGNEDQRTRTTRRTVAGDEDNL